MKEALETGVYLDCTTQAEEVLIFLFSHRCSISLQSVCCMVFTQDSEKGGQESSSAAAMASLIPWNLGVFHMLYILSYVAQVVLRAQSIRARHAPAKLPPLRVSPQKPNQTALSVVFEEEDSVPSLCEG
jgi:hypothetical protein